MMMPGILWKMLEVAWGISCPGGPVLTRGIPSGFSIETDAEEMPVICSGFSGVPPPGFFIIGS